MTDWDKHPNRHQYLRALVAGKGSTGPDLLDRWRTCLLAEDREDILKMLNRPLHRVGETGMKIWSK